MHQNSDWTRNVSLGLEQWKKLQTKKIKTEDIGPDVNQSVLNELKKATNLYRQ